MRSFTVPPAHSQEQRAALAARHRSTGVGVGVVEQRGGKTGGKVQLHHIAGIVVGEQESAIVSRNGAIGIVALP
jgi:hypothetical protein